MTTINDQPQHLLARYADRTGCENLLKWKGEHPLSTLLGTAQEAVASGATIEIVLSEYGLPSHLTPYKDNPRLPGDGYRVPVEGESRNQPHQYFGSYGWMGAGSLYDTFRKGLSFDQRLPASVLPPDWDEMTREDAPAGAESCDNPTQPAQPEQKDLVVKPSPHPEIFEAHGLEWYRHDGSVKCPCDAEDRVEILFRYELESGMFESSEMSAWQVPWSNNVNTNHDIIGWRPADAPAKLPRPEQQPQDDVQESTGIGTKPWSEPECEVDDYGNKFYHIGQWSKSTSEIEARLIVQSVNAQAQDHINEIVAASQSNSVEALKARVQELEAQLEAKLEDIVKAADQIDHWKSLARRESDGRINAEEKLNSASTPTLRPIAEMPSEVPEGFKRIFWSPNSGWWGARNDLVTHFLDIRLPAPPDPDAELRREFEAWMKGHYQIPKSTLTFIKENGVYALREHERAFQAYKAGRCAHPQGAAA